MSEIKKVVLVGHCGFDAATLRRTVADILPGVDALSADTATEVDDAAEPSSLLLINRVLDGGFDVDCGIDLIRRLSQRDKPPKMMLISNYADAQQAAIEAGALPGFGKADVRSPAVAEHLRKVAEGRPVA